MSEAQVKAAVYRVVSDQQKLRSLGTAFAISEHLLLSCHHVVAGRSDFGLVDKFGRFIEVVETYNPPMPQHLDLSILRVDEALSNYLPLYATTNNFDSYSATGFIEGDQAMAPSFYQFDYRGRKDAKYGSYQLPEVIEMIGDLAGPGLSGSPLCDSQNSTVLAMICGGIAKKGRTWALPLNAMLQWSEFASVYRNNDEQLSKFGVGMNFKGALALCEAKSRATLRTYEHAQKYDSSRNVDRSDIHKALNDFADSDKTFMALVGDANVGKSWVLCDHIKKHLGCQAMVLVNAAFEVNLDILQEPQKFLVNMFFASQHSVANEASSPVDLAKMVKACANAKKPLMVIFDGINEIDQFKRFASQWLPQLVGTCVDLGIKIVVSCRSERWIGIHNHLKTLAPHFFRHRFEVPSEDGPKIRSENYFRLEGFNQKEAKQAIERYQLTEAVLPVLGSHPLSYKIATEIKLDDFDKPIGRYDLLMRFIRHQLGNAADILDLANHHGLWADIKALANNSEAYTGGLINWPNAYKLVDKQTLQALLDCSLLISDEHCVKFTYDEVADALQDIAQDWVAPLLCKPGEYDKAIDQGLLYNVLLRLEYQQQQTPSDEQFSHGIDLLCRLIKQIAKQGAQGVEVWQPDIRWSQIKPVLALAGKTAAALPPSRNKQTLELFQALSAAANVWYLLGEDETEIGKWIEKSAIDEIDKCRLLLSILHLDNSWPLRIKDWEDDFRRESFRAFVGDTEFISYVTTRIIQLYQTNQAKIMSVLLNYLNDDTLLLKESGLRKDVLYKGEATISSAVCGILSLTSEQYITQLLPSLIEHTGLGVFELKRFIFRHHTQTACQSVISTLVDKMPTQNLLQTLKTHINDFNEGQQQQIKQRVGALLSGSLEASYLAYALELLRVLEPTNSTYYLSLLKLAIDSGSEQSAFYLSNIPDDCIDALIPITKSHPFLVCEIIFSAVADLHDERAELLVLVKALTSDCDFLDAGNNSIGSLFESVLHRHMQDRTKFVDWLELIAKVAMTAKERTLRNLIYAAFHNSQYYEYFRDIVNGLQANPLLYKEVRLIASRLVRAFDVDKYKALIHQYRALGPHNFDFEMTINLLMKSSDANMQVIEFWQGLTDAEHSEVSTLLLKLHEEGEIDPFSREVLKLIKKI